MFKDYKYIKYLGYNKADNTYSYEYEITDSGGWTAVGVAIGVEVEVVAVGVAIIDCYTKKRLPVAPNLIRAMLLIREKYGYSLDDQVSWNKKYNPRWCEVEKDMQMYLLFS